MEIHSTADCLYVYHWDYFTNGSLRCTGYTLYCTDIRPRWAK